MNQYPNGPQQPYGQPQYPYGQGQPQYPPQPPRELIRVRCGQGTLIITDTQIRIDLWGREQSMSRGALTGVDYRLTMMSLFGLGGAATLTFHGQGGERMIATLIRPRIAKQAKQMLGY